MAASKGIWVPTGTVRCRSYPATEPNTSVGPAVGHRNQS
jgi:hypothetical protein